MLVFRLTALLLLLPLVSLGQVKTYRVEAEQRVQDGYLEIDVFIQRLGGDSYSLASSNFSFFLTAANLDIAHAEINHAHDGVWDNDTDPAGYLDLGLKQKDNFVVLNVNCKSQFKSLNPGPGQPVATTRSRIGRVRIPILNPAGFNTLTWRLAPSAVMRWDATNILAEGEFVTPAPDYPLCDVPHAPIISGPADTTICSNQPITLTSSWSGSQQWFRDGQAITGATQTAITVAEPGRYTVIAYNYSCASDISNPVDVDVLWVDEPTLRRDNRLLVAHPETNITWFRNGERIPGANGSTYVLRESGSYYIETPSNCGTLRSNVVEVDFSSEPLVSVDSSDVVSEFAAYPNPYPTFTYLSFTLERASHVVIDITTPSGVVIQQLVDDAFDAGKYKVRFSAHELGQPTGTYIARLITDRGVRTIKIVEGA